MVKRISALAAVLLCVFMLCSCTASRSQIGAYVRGTLDSVYLNENSDEYLESVGGTAEECEAQYQQYIRDEVEYFKMCMDIDEVSDATYQRMVKIFETLYAHCKYEVGEVTRSSDRFLVSVTFFVRTGISGPPKSSSYVTPVMDSLIAILDSPFNGSR